MQGSFTDLNNDFFELIFLDGYFLGKFAKDLVELLSFKLFYFVITSFYLFAFCVFCYFFADF